MNRYKYILMLCFSITGLVKGQTIFEQNYYISNLNSFQFFNPELSSLLSIPSKWEDQQIQLRWNGHFYQGEYLSGHLSIRNRFFSGFQWENDLFDFKKALESSSLHFNSLDEKKIGIHHQIDRLYGQWEKGNWNIRWGRQRINWGIQNYWNSHDLFNQTDFFDFDYIERPGADALRIQYFKNNNSSIEWAMNQDIQAGLLSFNLKKYDFQILAGKYFKDYSIGLGWAGQIKDVGFKGEFASFSNFNTSEYSWLGSISIDYSFISGLYLSAGCLYNSMVETFNPLALFSLDISAKNPMPFQCNFLYQINYPIHPLIQVGTAVIHDGELDFIFINPQIIYSISSSLDLMISSQNTWVKLNEKLKSINQILFTRLQLSF